MLPPPLPLLLLFTLYLVSMVCGELRMMGPRFVEEPAARVAWPSGAGVRVQCAARGDPPPLLRWLHDDNTPLHDLPGLRRVYDNGTLEILPSRALDAAPLTVRCRAANAHGIALSRDITLQPVSDEGWEVVASTEPVAAGGVAAVTCGAAPGTALVRVTLWYRDGAVLQLDEPSPESRYMVAGNTLLIREVSRRDAGEYSCLARHALTATTKRARPATLTLTEGSVSMAPRLAGAGEAQAAVGRAVCLPCAAPAHPQPHYTWYREHEGRLQEVPERGAWRWARGAALCVLRPDADARGVWLCKAYNSFGDAAKRITLHVDDPLTVTITPTVIVADTGGTATFTCTSSGSGGATLSWLHDGAAAGTGDELRLRDVTRAHRGVYQCRAHTHHDNAQAAAELRLGASSPELQYTFIEQALRGGGGGGVSLRCAALGAPPPLFTWLLDDVPLDHYRAPHRYLVSTERAADGAVVSTLNISAVTHTDGGRYSCRAENRLGSVTHTARLNIYGPPSIRPLGPVRVVAGANATIYCPYAGYPISSVRWSRRGGGALDGGGRVAARGAALRLAPAAPRDAGHYTCAVTAPNAPPHTLDLEIQVRNPPKISPFMFSSDLSEGSAAQVLCGVSSGDKPLFFSWLKDGAPLPADLQIEEKSLNEFSLLMFSELSARHSGAYTCRVANHASTVNYTATLNVKVAPSWSIEPADTAAVLVGEPLRLPCGAAGHPTPTLFWQRRIEAARVDSGGNVSAVAGRDATLTCEARGDGPLAMHWWRHGERLDLTSYRWSVSEVRLGDALRSTLSLRTATRDDAGAYRCRAHNAHGAADQTLYLDIEEPPAAARALRLRGVGGRWVRVAWSAPEHAHQYVAQCTPLHVAPPAGLALNLTLDPDDRHSVGADGERVASARVEGLRPAVAYSLRLVAANHVGRSPLSEPLLFTTLEEAPTASPQNLRVRASSPDELHVAWSPPRQDSWNGELLGYVMTWRETGGAGSAGGTEEEGSARSGSETARGWSAAELALSELRPAARYAVTVRAFNRAGAGPHSPVVYATTADGAPDAAPVMVSCEIASVRSLRVRWAPLTSAPTPSLRGYDLHYAPLRFSPGGGTGAGGGAGGGAGAGVQRARAGAGGEATLQGLRAATNYSVWVRARGDAGVGPTSTPAYCATGEDVPEAVDAVRAVATSEDTVRVTWLTADAATATRITHYTLYTRELGKVGGEWATRVDAAPSGVLGATELRRDVNGLRARTLYEFRVSAVGSVGPGPPSRPVTAAPAIPTTARITSFSRTVYAAAGERVRLSCGAVGVPPLRRRWSPLPPAHTLTDDGDLIILGVHESMGGNYTCIVRGGETLRVRLVVVSAPAAPAPRLLRAERHALLVAWDRPPDTDAPLIGYTVWWWREERGGEGGVRSAVVPGGEAVRRLPALACGARYGVTLQAHNALGASPRSPPLYTATLGDKPVAAAGDQFVWANSSSLRFNLLAWRARCPVVAWRVALRPASSVPPAPWRDLPTDGESAEVHNLESGAWYEVRVEARAAAGVTAALYRAPTAALSGESIGSPVEVRGAPPGAAEGGAVTQGRAAFVPALLAAGLLALLVALAGLVIARRRRLPSCVRQGCSPPGTREPHPQLYTTEPGKKNGKTSSLSDGRRSLHEISPYATFSMAGGAGGGAGGAAGGGCAGGGGCALHLHTFAGAEALDLAAPPPRPNLLAHNTDYGRRRDTSDSESSGSPCAVCAAELYGAPAAHLSDTLPAAVESSAEDTVYGGAALGGRARRRERSRPPRRHAPPAARSRRSPR